MSTEINQTRYLTDRQERFAHEYLIDQNASAACLRAGYSAKSRGPQAAYLMSQPVVRERIRVLLEELYTRIKLDAERLLKERMRVAFFDARKLFDADSEPIPFKDLDAESGGVMLVSYDTRSNGDKVTRVRQPSRAAALTALEKRYMRFMQLQAEERVNEREHVDLCLMVGRDPAQVKADGVLRFTAGRKQGWLADSAVEVERVPEPAVEKPAEQPAAPAMPMAARDARLETMAAPVAGTRAEPAVLDAAPVSDRAGTVATAAPSRPAKVCVPNRKASNDGRTGPAQAPALHAYGAVPAGAERSGVGPAEPANR